MPEETVVQPDGSPEHPSVSAEPSDANFKWIMWILIGAAVFAVVVHIGIALYYFGFMAHEERVKKSPYPLASSPQTGLPKGPRLEQINRLPPSGPPNEKSDVYLRQERREDLRDSYGPSSESGYVHVPVERAIDRLLQSGQLKHRPEAKGKEAEEQTRRAGGLVDAGGPNSGRLFNADRPKGGKP